MSTAGLAARQVRYATVSYLRNPPAVFFGLLMPVLFLVIFATVFGNDTIESRGGISQSTYYVPGLVALGIVSTTFVNLAMAWWCCARTACSSACAARRCRRPRSWPGGWPRRWAWPPP